MPAPELTPEALKALLASPTRPTLVDVREAWEVQLAPFPAPHVHIPLGELAARAEDELDGNAPIVTICHHGVRSLHAVMVLRSLGFANALSLKGGTDLWSVAIDPGLRRY